MLEYRQVFNGREPHLVKIHTEVVVNEFVAHSGNVIPRNMRVLAAQLARQPFGGLANNFDLPDDSILDEGIGKRTRLRQRPTDRSRL